MRFEILITLTAGFVVFGAVSGDLCAQSKELRKTRKNQTNNSSEQKQIYQKYNTVVVEELRYCDEGYTERFCDENEYVCEPVCPAGCENGTCIAPGICVCAEGLELRVNVENAECVPLTMENYVRHRRTVTKGESDDLDNCRKLCDYCWKNIHQDDCLEICGPTKSNCLEPEFSVCNESNKTIAYTKGSTKPEIYTCDTKTKTNPIYQTRYDKGSLCMLIGGSIFIGLMLIAIVYLCVRIYQTRHETGAHDIPISLLMKF